MSDHNWVYITAFWSEERQRNVFGLRGMGEKCEAVSNEPGFTFLSMDWPWAYFVFENHDAENDFMVKYEIDYDNEFPYRKGAIWAIPCAPRLKLTNKFSEELCAMLSEEITKAIDEEIMAEMKKLT